MQTSPFETEHVQIADLPQTPVHLEDNGSSIRQSLLRLANSHISSYLILPKTARYTNGNQMQRDREWETVRETNHA